MKQAMALMHLTHCSSHALPDAPGVVLIMCKKADGTFGYLDHKECGNIRKTVDDLSGQLQYACGGELAYWTCTEADNVNAARDEAERISKR